MENVKGILTMLHDKPKLTKKERKIADNYYELESQKLDILAKKKVLSSKEVHKNEDNYINEVKENNDALKLVNTQIKKMEKDIQLFRMHVTDIIKNTFIELGYNVEMKLLNAANYGVPQKRERVIFIGLRNDINKEIVYPTETHNKNGTDGKKKWVSVREAIDDLKDKKEDYEDLQQIYTSHNDAFIEKIKKYFYWKKC